MPVAAGIEQDQVKFAVEALQCLEISGIRGTLRGRDVDGEFREQARAAVGAGLRGDKRLQRGAASVQAEDLRGRECVNAEPG
jgi:hypothetical protein